MFRVVCFLIPLSLFAQEGRQESPHEAALKQLLDVMDRASMVLGLITNSENGNEARPEIKKFVEEFVKVRKASESLPPPKKELKDMLAKEYKTKVELSTKKFLAEIERIRRLAGMKGVLEELRPILDYKTK